MELVNAVKERRSIRRFSDKSVSPELISKIVSNAVYAPSWKNTQTTRYIAIENSLIKNQIADDAVCGFEFNSNTIKNAPALIAVTTRNLRSGYERDGSFSTSKGTHWQSFDAGIATQTFCLLAYAKGLGTCIMGIYDEKKVKQILNISDDYSVSALIAIGFPASPVEVPKRKTADDVLSVIE